MRWFGPCSDGDESFDLTLTVPEVVENGSANNNNEFSSASANVKRGLWTVTFSRTQHLWSGASHVFDIYKTGFKVTVTDGTSMLTGSFPDQVYLEPPYWPCNDVDDTHFTDDELISGGFAPDPGPGLIANPPPDPHNGFVCKTSFQFDLGCPRCGNTPLVLKVFAVSDLAIANAYSFDVRAVGTWLG